MSGTRMPRPPAVVAADGRSVQDEPSPVDAPDRWRVALEARQARRWRIRELRIELAASRAKGKAMHHAYRLRQAGRR